jgi:hypothetical protein
MIHCHLSYGYFVTVNQIAMTTAEFVQRWLQEEFEDTKGVIGIRKSKDRQHNGKSKKDKQRSTKLKIE